MSYIHIPVLLSEIIQYLDPQPNQNFVDCTIGGGGHAEAILEKTGPNGKLLGIDLDPKAIETVRERLKKYGNRLILVQDNFKNINEIIYGSPIDKFSGILFDLGLSSAQLEERGRGFSFQTEGALDMRFGGEPRKIASRSRGEGELTAAQILNTWPERELTRIFREYGEEKRAHLISQKVIENRKGQKFETSKQLVNTILSACHFKKSKIHPATKVFQALRIAVNDELTNLRQALPRALEILEPSGKLAVISFHSLEDRIVKRFFQLESRGCICPQEFPICQCGHKPRLAIITKKPIRPTAEEVTRNHRARSARLRVGEKLE